MLRKPRETPTDAPADVTTPSVGRAPTPPHSASQTKSPFTLAVPPSVPPPKMKMAASKAKGGRQAPLPTIGRQGAGGGSTKKAAPAAKHKGKPNGNIMAFFKKEEEAAGLFVKEKNGALGEVLGEDLEIEDNVGAGVLSRDGGADEEGRFNEDGGSVKRRKTNLSPCAGAATSTQDLEFAPPSSSIAAASSTRQKKAGPFLEDSDSDEDEQPEAAIALERTGQDDENSTEMVAAAAPEQEQVASPQADVLQLDKEKPADPPPLIEQETSVGDALEGFDEFDGLEDFDEDVYEEGDEAVEKRYMEEQARLEAEEGGRDYDPLPADDDAPVKNELDESKDPSAAAPSCPICNVSLGGVSERDAGVHVNNCLDGNPSLLPDPPNLAVSRTPIKEEQVPESASAHRFRKPAREPKPGQANPFAMGKPEGNGGSAFNKLMSGHAEDAAWAEAAASESASRGKPSYTRTCPFYKILPGLSICVDAFRYGAVEGCRAYFLSHFHSDHYIGLTSYWNHGPIYCSKVTANLVRQQLRVDAKWVVGLDFEETAEVPGTNGAKVTMISANHCPGSSLFLFEKVVGKKMTGEPKLQRILHCGDFRACRDHIEHPLLMPDVCDKVSGGRMKEQKIDVCYLDTTYLNPKYAFPSQEAVIQACSDMCVSLSKHSIDDDDGWERMKRRRAGEGMAKFVRKESNPQAPEDPLDNTENIKLAPNPHAAQQVLATSNTPDVPAGRGRLLVVVGTYSIGKERVCLGIARALDSKIYAPTAKQRIVAALEDPELNARMTTDPRAAQVHMTPLFEIRGDTLEEYMAGLFPHFTRAVGFRPSGWNYRPPNSRFVDSPSVQTVLYGGNWKSAYSMKELVPQRGSTSRASTFGVPYSEHSSFRELTMFCTALRIEKIIPTVNVGSAKTREKMKAWCERWAQERKKNGLYKLPEDGSW